MMRHRQVEQATLFYEFSLEKHVPADHLLRSIDRFRRAWRVEVGSGRVLTARWSPIDRSRTDDQDVDRRLFTLASAPSGACAMKSISIWPIAGFVRLGLDGHVPDHSTLSKNRHGRFRESDLLRRVFETVLQRCIREGLVGGEAFAIDASLIRADANRQTFLRNHAEEIAVLICARTHLALQKDVPLRRAIQRSW